MQPLNMSKKKLESNQFSRSKSTDIAIRKKSLYSKYNIAPSSMVTSVEKINVSDRNERQRQLLSDSYLPRSILTPQKSYASFGST